MNGMKIKITILLVFMVNVIISGVMITNFDEKSSKNIQNNYPRSQNLPATSDAHIKFTAANISEYFAGNVTNGTSWIDAYSFEDLVFPAIVNKTYFEFEATTAYVIFNNCTFVNVGIDQGAIFLDNADNVLIKNCKFLNCYYGVYAYSSQNSVIEYCTFTNNYNAINFNYYTYGNATGNLIQNSHISITLN